MIDEPTQKWKTHGKYLMSVVVDEKQVISLQWPKWHNKSLHII